MLEGMSDYKPQSADTSIEIEGILLERYRAMAPAEKVHIFRELCRVSQELALAGLRLRHPAAGPEELRMRLAATRLPTSIMEQVFGRAPEDSS